MRLPLLLPRLSQLPRWAARTASQVASIPRPPFFPKPAIPPPAPAPAAAPHGSSVPLPKEKRDDDSRLVDDALDPLTRHAAQLAPPLVTALAPAAATPPSPSPPTPISLEELLPQLVRKLALAGDGKRATVRVEIGAGALEGATLLVSNETGGIRVDVEAPGLASGVDRDAWSTRIRQRLEAKGLRVESIRIT